MKSQYATEARNILNRALSGYYDSTRAGVLLDRVVHDAYAAGEGESKSKVVSGVAFVSKGIKAKRAAHRATHPFVYNGTKKGAVGV